MSKIAQIVLTEGRRVERSPLAGLGFAVRQLTKHRRSATVIIAAQHPA